MRLKTLSAKSISVGKETCPETGNYPLFKLGQCGRDSRFHRLAASGVLEGGNDLVLGYI